MSTLFKSLWMLAAVFLLQSPTRADEMPSLTPAMKAAIQRIAPHATPLTKAEIASGCGDDIPSDPGLIVADFNGDGRPDVAVLVTTGEPGKIFTWEGESRRLVNFAFAIMVDDGKGSFAIKLLQRFDEDLPLGEYIDILAPGQFTDRETGKDVTIRNPSIDFENCEKSDAMYYSAA
jgi:hypothetical protein